MSLLPRLLLPLLAAFSAAQPAAPAALPQAKVHKEHCTGTLTTLEPGTLHFAGEGNATHFGHYSIVGSNDFDEFGNVLNGQFTTTVPNGSTISGVYAGTYTPLADGSIRFDVTVQWLAGTGKLAGVTGQAEVVAFLDALEPGAAFEYFTDGFLFMP